MYNLTRKKSEVLWESLTGRLIKAVKGGHPEEMSFKLRAQAAEKLVRLTSMQRPCKQRSPFE